MAIITVISTENNGDGSLREAIAKAKSGDTIKFARTLTNQTIILERSLIIDKDLTIDGANVPGLTLSGNQESIIFKLTGKGREFTTRSLKFTDAFHSYAGGAIWAQDSKAKITVVNSKFKNNVAGQGSAIWAKEGANVTVINSIFDGNKATQRGVDSAAGAISVFNKSQLTVADSEFINNKGDAGGAIGTIFTELTIENSSFFNNESRRYGGAVHSDGASVPSQKRYYQGNLPRDNKGGEVTIRHSHFEGNRTSGFGGGISVWGYDQDFVTIDNSTIINNKVTKNKSGTAQGGGMRLSGFININNTTIAKNKSHKEGGGLWYLGEVPTKIKNSTFSGNKAKDTNNQGLGGAIYDGLWGSETNIENTTFEDNYAGSEAGAIYTPNNRSITIQDSIFDNNKTGNSANNQQSNFEVFEDITESSLRIKNNILQGSNKNDSFNQGAGNDILSGRNGRDRLKGGDGNDSLDGGSDNDSLWGGKGSDFLEGGFGDDRLDGGAGKDTLNGGYHNDTLKGGKGNDRLNGGAGNDRLTGNRGHDTLWGGNHSDYLGGGAGNDYLEGNTGNDTLVGGSGNDTLVGGQGNDQVVGDVGNDILIGSMGRDFFRGGSGKDKFVLGDNKDIFYKANGNQDYAIVSDFQHSQDVIALKSKASNYHLSTTSKNGISGTGIYTTKDELIAIVQNIEPQDLNLNANYFNYI
ncbi:MAG: hypothetical protein F6K36_12360 [Symploca sp. SIO3C6]|uniref:Right handed beta helix domain-containing protein n=1 Tax=Symploca sp. SIO1C4 TaxID=2607765 RepID=A0A6B3N546_9CYAN|nr:hypothetical protein [Symploca sp. SIO3C6]NER26727.1 hypothetical protein [Symploca sp. SIO1C4]